MKQEPEMPVKVYYLATIGMIILYGCAVFLVGKGCC